MANTRKTTNTILELMDEGVFDPRAIAEMCLTYMSESEVADMARINGLIADEDEEEGAGCGEDCCGASCICHAR
jgi:hypothetical protein